MKTKFTPFGLRVKKKLLDVGHTQRWLENEVRDRTGLFVDSGYMHKILTGQRNAPRIACCVREILDLPSVDETIDNTDTTQSHA